MKLSEKIRTKTLTKCGLIKKESDFHWLPVAQNKIKHKCNYNSQEATKRQNLNLIIWSKLTLKMGEKKNWKSFIFHFFHFTSFSWSYLAFYTHFIHLCYKAACDWATQSMRMSKWVTLNCMLCYTPVSRVQLLHPRYISSSQSEIPGVQHGALSPLEEKPAARQRQIYTITQFKTLDQLISLGEKEVTTQWIHTSVIGAQRWYYIIYSVERPWSYITLHYVCEHVLWCRTAAIHNTHCVFIHLSNVQCDTAD